MLAGVCFDILFGCLGVKGWARLRFDLAEGMRGFNLVLQRRPDQLYSTSAGDFQRDAALVPESDLGEHSLNIARDASPGRIHIIGLAPMATKRDW